MKLYGLVGYPLSHSFSKKYFTQKFEQENLSQQFAYELFELADPKEFIQLFEKHPNLMGVNVTIPHKQNLYPYLNSLDISAQRVGAVNVVKKNSEGQLIGYNSDYYGFKKSFEENVSEAAAIHKKAMILGYGGAAKAIVAALEDLGYEILIVSRLKSSVAINYEEAIEYIADYKVIVNCTPLGTFPKVDDCPAIAYEKLNSTHYLHDLIYNPDETLFLKLAKKQGAKTKNGYDMLVYQAEKSWEIWNDLD